MIVASGVTWTVNPGVVVKMWYGQEIIVDGTLNAPGTLTQPIVFTSRNDDSVLGDTYHDGSTAPDPDVTGPAASR